MIINYEVDERVRPTVSYNFEEERSFCQIMKMTSALTVITKSGPKWKWKGWPTFTLQHVWISKHFITFCFFSISILSTRRRSRSIRLKFTKTSPACNMCPHLRHGCQDNAFSCSIMCVRGLLTEMRIFFLLLSSSSFSRLVLNRQFVIWC